MQVSRSDGLRCDFSTNKLTISTSKMSFCNFNSKPEECRYNVFFSFKYSSFLFTLEPRAKTPLPDSFECFFDPQRSFGNPLQTFRQSLANFSAIPCELFSNTLRALFLKNRDFFCYDEIFLPNTREALGCLLDRILAVWAKTLRGNNLRLIFEIDYRF